MFLFFPSTSLCVLQGLASPAFPRKSSNIKPFSNHSGLPMFHRKWSYQSNKCVHTFLSLLPFLTNFKNWNKWFIVILQLAWDELQPTDIVCMELSSLCTRFAELGEGRCTLEDKCWGWEVALGKGGVCAKASLPGRLDSRSWNLNTHTHTYTLLYVTDQENECFE